MRNLGRIAISYLCVETVSELTVALEELAGTANLDRIVLVVPKRVRDELGWPETAAPNVAIWKHDLVFTPQSPRSHSEALQ